MRSSIEEPDTGAVHELGRIFSLPPGRARNIGIHLQTAILEHRLKPGAKLSEDEVGEIFGVSRTVVRMALQALAHSKLVTIERNRGAFVSMPSVKDANEVFEARALIEPRIVHMAADHAGIGDIAYLRAHIEAEHRALTSGDLGKALALSGLFHIAISDRSFLRSLISRSSLIIALYWKRPDTTCESHSHAALIDALEAKDPQAAEEIMRTHIADLHSGLDLTEKHVIELPLANILGLKKDSFSE